MRINGLDFAKSIRISVSLVLPKGVFVETKVNLCIPFSSFVASFLCFSFSVPSLFVSLFFLPCLPFRYPYPPLRPSSLFLSLVPLLRCTKVQRRGLPVVDDQRGFPFSTLYCCAATTAALLPSFSLLSSSLFFRALGSTGMIILYEKIQRELHERL